MKDWRRKYQIYFITLISFWVLISPTYRLFYSLDNLDVFRSLHLENPIQADLLADVGLLLLHLRFRLTFDLHQLGHRGSDIDSVGLAAEGIVDAGENAGEIDA